MISQLTTQDAPAFPHLFRSMHEDRKSVFVDTLQWDIEHDGEQERDQFDTPAAHYLVLHDPDLNQHLGSVRLLPTTRPHLMSDVFAHLCEAGVPTGPATWEISRLLVSPQVSRSDRLMVRNMLGRAMIEYGLLTGIQRYTCVCEIGFLSQLLASGWRCDPLGLPQNDSGAMIAALLIHCDSDSLARTKAAWRFDSPVLRLTEPRPMAA